jgi:hypothetical protein
MTKRYSGRATVDVEFVDAKNEYRARVSTPDGTETVWVGVPPALKIAVDSPEAYDGAASAALSFAYDDFPDLSISDYAHDNPEGTGWWIGRSEATAWPKTRVASLYGPGSSERRRRRRRR